MLIVDFEAEGARPALAQSRHSDPMWDLVNDKSLTQKPHIG
jgi:hypothetical protein